MTTDQTSNAAALDRIIFPEGGSYLWGALAGPSQAAKRQAVLAQLGQKLPRSKCGYNQTVQALYEAFGISDGCPRDRDSRLIEALKGARQDTKD